MIGTFFASTFGKVLAVGGILLALGGMALYLVNNLEGAGAANVTTAVEHTTNVELEKARKDKANADEKVRTEPQDQVIDSTR